jgi:hypothetical protein
MTVDYFSLCIEVTAQQSCDNVLKTNMSRATGTILDPNSKAFTALSLGKTFHGVIDILGKPYITRYDPMYDASGAMVGAYYAGYKVDMKVIRDALHNTRQLKSGFAMVLDGHNKVRLHSANVLLAEAKAYFMRNLRLEICYTRNS